MDKKRIMVVGFAIFTVSSVLGIAIQEIWYFVAMRLLATGVGWGITNTAALSILADLFTDGTEHGKYVGWYNSVMSILGAVLASSAGYLAVGTWQNAFLVYLIAIPVLLMLVVFLPSFPPVRPVAESVEEVRGESTSSVSALARGLFCSHHEERAAKGWWKPLAPLSVQVFLVAMLYFVMLYMVALYVADAGIGDESFAGILTSLMTIATAIGSLTFGFFYKRFSNAVYVPALFVIAGVFFVLAFFPSAPVVMIALGIAGLMWPFYFCFFYTRCTEIVPAGKQSAATSIVATADGLAVTASSYLLTGTIGMTGGSCLTVYPLFGAAMLAIALVSVLVHATRQRKKASSSARNAA